MLFVIKFFYSQSHIDEKLPRNSGKGLEKSKDLFLSEFIEIFSKKPANALTAKSNGPAGPWTRDFWTSGEVLSEFQFSDTRGTPDVTWCGDFNADGRTDIATIYHTGRQLFLALSAGFRYVQEIRDLDRDWPPWPREYSTAQNSKDRIIVAQSMGGGEVKIGVWKHAYKPGKVGNWVGNFNNDDYDDIFMGSLGTLAVNISTGEEFVQDLAPNFSPEQPEEEQVEERE